MKEGHLGALFFASPAEFRTWLEANHATASDAWIGYWKKSSGRHGMSYEQSLDEALCFGWIDGLTRRIDDDRYAIRFTPRRARSNWSQTNIRRVAELRAEGRMAEAGQRAYEARATPPLSEYTWETRPAELPETYASIFRRSEPAWRFFNAQRPSYRKSMAWFVVSARREETRLSRLEVVIAESAAERVIDVMRLPKLSDRR